MPPKSLEADLIRVKHVIEAIAEAKLFLKNKTLEELRHDRMLTLALIKEIEMIGEAASKITVPFQKKYQNVPWSSMVAIRNRLIHGYFDVDIEILWTTMVNDILPLQRIFKKIVLQEK